MIGLSGITGVIGLSGITGVTGLSGVTRIQIHQTGVTTPVYSNVPVGFGGFTGVTGLSGITGIAVIKCSVCEAKHIYQHLSINFSIAKMDPVSINNPLEDRSPICETCFHETVKAIHELASGSIEECPLYISHNNNFIREFAIRRIKGFNNNGQS